MSQAAADRRRQAEERRQRILASGPTRLSRIQGRPVESAASPEPPPPSAPPRDFAPRRPRPGGEAPLAAPPKRSRIETAAAAFHCTRRLRVLLAVLIACWEAAGRSNSLALFLTSEAVLFSTAWFLLLLTPASRLRQVRIMRHEMKFRRGCGLDWKPSLLYMIPGLSHALHTVDDLYLCLQTFHADVAVFLVLRLILLKTAAFL